MRRDRVFVLAEMLLFSSVSVACAQHEHAGHQGMRHQMASGVKLDAQMDPATRTLTLRLGPMNLPADSDHMRVAQPPAQLWAVPIDGWLMAYHPRLTDGSGRAVPGRLLHHVAFWNTGRSDFLCVNKEEHIFGAGGELNDWRSVPGYGYRVRKGDRIRIDTMVHNPTHMNYPHTYLEVRMEYQPSNAVPSGPIKSVYPTWFDVKECGRSGYDLKPGENVTSAEIPLRYSGTLLGVGGHLHDYGQSLRLENVTRREEIAKLDSTLDTDGHIISMPIVTFFERGGYRLNKGERVRVTAVYENRAGKLLPDGAMGIVVGYFLPENESDMSVFRRTEQSHK